MCFEIYLSFGYYSLWAAVLNGTRIVLIYKAKFQGLNGLSICVP